MFAANDWKPFQSCLILNAQVRALLHYFVLFSLPTVYKCDCCCAFGCHINPYLKHLENVNHFLAALE
jgi:hypothetical protein